MLGSYRESCALHSIEISRIHDKLIRYDCVSGWEVPFSDFNTYHKCRNLDTVLDWVTNHRVHVSKDHMHYEVHKFNLLQVEAPQ